MLTGRDLVSALQNKVISRPHAGLHLRATSLLYAADPLGKNRGKASALSAGRFNLAGGARVLYLGDTHQTCAAEAQAVGGASFAIAIIPVHVRLQAMIDLCDPATLDALELTSTEVALNFRLHKRPTPTQQLGEACVRTGAVDGIRYASLTPVGGLCLAVLEASLRGGASLVVNDPRNKLVLRQVLDDHVVLAGGICF